VIHKHKTHNMKTSSDPDDGVMRSQSDHICRVPVLSDFVCCYIQYTTTVHCLCHIL